MQRLKFGVRLGAVLALFLLSAVSLASYAFDTRNAWRGFVARGTVDDITRWENRLAELKSHIPPGVDRVGYISSDPEHIEFYLTQYAIIPAVLERGVAPDWIIANYSDKSIQLILKKYLDLDQYAVESFGNGLYLVHKR